MPARALRPCSIPGCSVLVRSGSRCRKHINAGVQREPDTKSMYNSPRWKAMRIQQLQDHPWCQACLTLGIYEPAEEVDHIRPHRGDPNLFFDDANLQSLSKQCHSRKTSNEVLRA